MRTLSNFAVAVAILISCAVYSMKTAAAQIIPSTVWVASAVPLASCALPAEAVSPVPVGYVVYCNSTSGLAQAIPPSTTFTLLAPQAPTGVTSFNGRTGAVTLTKADVLGTNFTISTTVTSTATSTPQ